MKNSKIFDSIIKSIAVVIALGLLAVIYFNHIRTVSNIHYTCNARFEAEAQTIAATVADYLSDNSRSRIPTMDVLVKTGEYVPLGNGRTQNGNKLVRESEFSIAIAGKDASQITIILSSKKGRCPFYRGNCQRRFLGRYYVYKMYGDHGRAWKDRYPQNSKRKETSVKS